MLSKNKYWMSRLFFSLLSAALLTKAVIEMNRVAWGTGIWLGEYSLKWAIGFFGFVLASLGLFVLVLTLAWSPLKLNFARDGLVRLRARLGIFRWLLAFGFLIAPVWFFQYTLWGVVFIGVGIRLLIWILTILGLAFVIGHGDSLIMWPHLLAASLLSGVVISAAIPLAGVTSYPFSLGWSEGNRLWDYSILFGRARYIFPPNQELSPFLDIGRQLVGGLPFLIPGLNIFQERLWLGLMEILPYFLLGLCIFYLPKTKPNILWLLVGLWGALFLRQGPIHTPLLLSAAIVAIAWRRPLWISLPLIAVAGYFAAVSRFTWTFAPAMWAGMLWLIHAQLDNAHLAARDWWRAIALGLAGLFGGYFVPQLTGLLTQAGNVNVAQAAETVSRQPLLWYRLLPNSTYNLGILINLLLAVVPLIVVLLFAIRRKLWILNLWQRFAILAVLAAFLIVGLVASTKIGGGGDLHNMDMFFIGLLFVGGIVWERSNSTKGTLWLMDGALPAWIRITLIVLVVLPAYGSLLGMRPLLYADEFSRLKTLTDIEDPYADPRVLGLLPPRDEVDQTLQRIQQRVADAKKQGDVLFMDQRQLLTFGYIKDVPLIPEYEKKYLMDQAMGGASASTFPSFYRDLAAHRFSLIISDPLRLPIKDSDYSFGEENNAWVKWVAAPILCYYEPDVTLDEFKIQLLIPRKTVSPDCALPTP